MPPPQKIRLGDLLIQQGLLTEEQLKSALEQQKLTGRKLGRVFVDSGFAADRRSWQHYTAYPSFSHQCVGKEQDHQFR